MTEKFSQKWAIASFFGDIKDGFEFHRSDTPLHTTLAGVFATQKKGIEIASDLYKLLKATTSFNIKAGETVNWGKNGEIKVVLIDKSSELMKVYEQIYNYLGTIGAIFNESKYEGKGYIPHSTVQGSGGLNRGDTANIKSVSLVDMFPNNDGYQRKIVKTIHLIS